MKISNKIDYACRVLIQLARRYDTGTLSQLEELSQCEDVSANFLAQILTDFRKNGLIESRRGREGGYFLAKLPNAISLYDIITLLEGDILEYSMDGKGESSPNVIEAWKRIRKSLESEMKSITLETMKEMGEEPMYFI